MNANILTLINTKAINISNLLKREGLKLFDNIIVSENVLTKWKEQEYDGSYSYTDKSPKDLNYLNLE